MSVGFGFSIGDFIKAIKLVSIVVDALRNNDDAGKQYHKLDSSYLVFKKRCCRSRLWSRDYLSNFIDFPCFLPLHPNETSRRPPNGFNVINSDLDLHFRIRWEQC